MLLWSHRPSLYSTYCRLQCGYMRLWVMNDYEPTRICGPTHHLFLRSPPITHFSSCTSSCIIHILSLFCSALMIFTLQNHLSETGVSSSGDKGIQMWGTILCKVTVKADCSFPFISFHSRVHDFSLVQTNQKQVALVCHHCFQLTQTLLFL